MPKTGFSNGFARVPAKKHYKYHGVNRDCNIEPVLPPYVGYPTYPPGAHWIVIYDVTVGEQLGDWKLVYNPDLFPPSSVGDPCSHSWPDGKRRYYFFELDIYGRGGSEYWNLSWSDGMNCCYDGGQSTRLYMHFEYSKLIWYGWDTWEDALIILNNIAGAHVRIWGSTNGELPEDVPTPEGYHF